MAHVFHQPFSEIDDLDLAELVELASEAKDLIKAIHGSR